MNESLQNHRQQYLENIKLERQERIQKNFNLDKELLKYINKNLSSIEEFKEEFTDAVKTKTDIKTLQSLAHEIEPKIDYLRPKHRDTKEQPNYIAKLEYTHQKLLKMLNKTNQQNDTE